MNNQIKAITSNPEVENNSVQQLRLTVTRARGTVPDKAKMTVYCTHLYTPDNPERSLTCKSS